MKRVFTPASLLRDKYQAFRTILQLDNQALDLLTTLESHISGDDPADPHLIRRLSDQISTIVGSMACQLSAMDPSYITVVKEHALLSAEIHRMLTPAVLNSAPPYVLPLEQAADYPQLAGGKATNLSIAGRAGVVIPYGFVITANAFHHIIQENHLEEEMSRRFRQVCASDHQAIIQITGELQELILGSEIPANIVDQIQSALQDLGPVSSLAVRSSALAEDGKISFAGQYASELEVLPENIIAAYKRVLAGKYCPRAITYRIRHGLSDDDTTMAALVVPMLSPRASGVLYTHDPATSTGEKNLGIYAVQGLAEGLVDGSRTPEKYHLARNDTDAQFFPGNSLLTIAEIKQLKAWGMLLEEHFGCPQDIEWALDITGLTVLQSRPLLQKQDPPPAPVLADDLEHLLYSELHCAAPGISCGPVYYAPTGKTFLSIPPGSVVLTPTLRPSLSQFLDRIAGVIAENGSRASHFSSVARERGIPVLVGNTNELETGQIVTVDAASGRVFKGCVNAVLQIGKLHVNTDFPTEKYADLAVRTIRLSLTDPDSETFIPEQCRSLHDIVRFCHEKSVREMFSLVGKKGRGLGGTRKLKTELPLVMYVLDLDNFGKSSSGDQITLEELSSRPMQALWLGLADPHIYWDTSQHHCDWEDFDQMSGGIFPRDSRILASYALTASEYLHLNIRFGYHFSVVDSICGEQASSNYINFRFKGGGAAHHQRLFRLEFIDIVLTAFGFETSCKGDLIDANFSRYPHTQTLLALTRLGLLLAETRMMDMRMTGSRHAAEEAKKFMIFAAKVTKASDNFSANND